LAAQDTDAVRLGLSLDQPGSLDQGFQGRGLRARGARADPEAQRNSRPATGVSGASQVAMQAKASAGRRSWTADPFHTEVERRADGTLYLRPVEALSAYPERLMDWLEHWAKIAPQRVLVARRGADGQWR